MKNIFSNRKYYINKIRSDSYYRSLATVTFSSLWNIVYTLYHFYLAMIYQSYWFFTMGIYYLIAYLMKIMALRIPNNKENNLSAAKALKINGWLMMLLSFVFSGMVCLSVIERRSNAKSTAVAIGMAAYTFFKVINAVINIINRKKRQTSQMIIIRNISLAYALGSMYGLERVLIGTFGNINDDFTYVMEITSGMIFYLFILLLGINMLILSAHINKKLLYK